MEVFLELNNNSISGILKPPPSSHLQGRVSHGWTWYLSRAVSFWRSGDIATVFTLKAQGREVLGRESILTPRPRPDAVSRAWLGRLLRGLQAKQDVCVSEARAKSQNPFRKLFSIPERTQGPSVLTPWSLAAV